MIERATTAGQAGFRCECLTEFSRLPDLAQDWQRLTSQDPHAEIFHSWHWASAFSRTYNGIVTPCVFVVHQEEHVVGILPLVRRGKRLEFLGSPHSDYNDILCAESDAAPVLEFALDSLLQWGDDWEYCALDKVSSQSRIVRHWTKLPSRLRKHLQITFLCPCPTVMLNQDRDAMLKKLTGRQDQKRHQKLLQKHGRVTFRHIETHQEAREHLRNLFSQHIARYACNGIRSQFLQAEHRAFFEALVEELDPRTQLRFAVLEVDNQPVAYHFGFSHKGKHTFYKPTFDVDHWEAGPGDVLLRHMFQYALDTGSGEFDFTVGDEPFKYRFANRINRNFTCYIDRFPARATTLLRRLERLARQMVRENPALKGILRRTVRRSTDGLSRTLGLLRAGRLPGHCRDAVRKLCRNAIWTHSEVQFFSSTPSAGLEPQGEVEIRQVGLSELARISLKYPELFKEAVLRDYRGRLRRGDRAFVACCADGELSLLWVGRTAEIPVAEIGPQCRLRLPEPVSVIYDVWTSLGSAVKKLRPEVLREAARRCTNKELWTYCFSDQPVAFQALTDAGFRPRERMDHRALLHWFRRSRVMSQAVPLSSGRESAAAWLPYDACR